MNPMIEWICDTDNVNANDHNCGDIEILLDGVKLDHVFHICISEGWVKQYVWPIVILPDDTAAYTILYGVVSVRMKDECNITPLPI